MTINRPFIYMLLLLCAVTELYRSQSGLVANIWIERKFQSMSKGALEDRFQQYYQDDDQIRKNCSESKFLQSNALLPSVTDAGSVNITSQKGSERPWDEIIDDEEGDLAFSPPYTPGAFVHVGKTGGSTLSSLLRHGCHSFVPKPCNELENESHLSKLATYYHVPDFHRLKEHNHVFYVFTTRDPFERTISAFTYMHPANPSFVSFYPHQKKVSKRFYKDCFDSLDTFAHALSSMNETEDKQRQVSLPQHCREKALDAMTNQNKDAEHLYLDHKGILRKVSENSQWNSSHVLVIRKERLWDDWISVNKWLGQSEESIVTSPNKHARKQMKQLVDGSISMEGRRLVCEHLQEEYSSYISLLMAARNLTPEDRLESLNVARKNCPVLESFFSELELQHCSSLI